MPARIVFMGSPAFAVPSLTVLAERPDLATLVAAVTQPDKPAGRGQKLTACPVKIAALARGLPVLTPTKMKAPETLAELALHQPDLIVVAAYGRILPRAILDLPRLGCVNVHASLLPRYRGASPINHALLAGDADTGVTLMRMEEGLDTGPMYSVRTLAIAADDTTGSLTVKLAELGSRLLIDSLPNLLNGKLTPTAQDDAQATYAPMLDKDDGRIDWRLPARELERRVRAMQPWPGAFTERDGVRVQLMKAEVVALSGRAGEVLLASKDGVVVGTGEDALRLLMVKPAGKSVMSAVAFVAGRGLAAGDVLR